MFHLEGKHFLKLLDLSPSEIEGLLDLATGESGRISAAVQKGSLAEQIKRLLADEAEK